MGKEVLYKSTFCILQVLSFKYIVVQMFFPVWQKNVLSRNLDFVVVVGIFVAFRPKARISLCSTKSDANFTYLVCL